MKKRPSGQKKLPAKLLRIRESLGLSQNDIIKAFRLDGLKRQQISAYENGEYEPALFVLVKYADAANICLDILIRDEYSLPESLPCKEKYFPH
jgi:transcriptional regulator with XRE-family HTH domain